MSTEAAREMSLEEVLNECTKLHPQHRARLELAELRGNLANAQEQLRALQTAHEYLGPCPTCEGDGLMDALVGYDQHGDEVLEARRCADCGGHGYSRVHALDIRIAELEAREALWRDVVLELLAKINEFQPDRPSKHGRLLEKLGFYDPQGVG